MLGPAVCRAPSSQQPLLSPVGWEGPVLRDPFPGVRTVTWEGAFLCFPFALASTVQSGQGGKTSGLVPVQECTWAKGQAGSGQLDDSGGPQSSGIASAEVPSSPEGKCYSTTSVVFPDRNLEHIACPAAQGSGDPTIRLRKHCDAHITLEWSSWSNNMV